VTRAVTIAAMSAIAHERSVGPRAPRFLATAWDAFVGFVLAAISIGVVTIPVFVLGLVGRDGTSGARRDAFDWPFTQNGIWSVAANLVVTVGVLLVCAAWISDRVRKRAEQPVSVLRTFAIVAVTGYAPYVAYRGLVPLHFVLGLLATALLVRRYAVGIPPLGLSRRRRRALLVAGASLLCIPAAYGATHPLWYESVVSGSGLGSYSISDGVVYHPRTGKTVRYEFLLKNSSLGRVTLLDVSGGSTPLMRVVGAAAGLTFPGDKVHTLAGTSVSRHGEQAVTLFIRVMGCDRLTGTASLDRIAVRYRLAGMTFTAPMLLPVRPTLVCSG
jgi:hypothetical protein